MADCKKMGRFLPRRKHLVLGRQKGGNRKYLLLYRGGERSALCIQLRGVLRTKKAKFKAGSTVEKGIPARDSKTEQEKEESSSCREKSPGGRSGSDTIEILCTTREASGEEKKDPLQKNECVGKDHYTPLSAEGVMIEFQNGMEAILSKQEKGVEFRPRNCKWIGFHPLNPNKKFHLLQRSCREKSIRCHLDDPKGSEHFF